MKKVKKVLKRLLPRAVYAVVVLTMIIQPVGSPGVLRSFAAEEAVTETAAPAPEAPKAESTSSSQEEPKSEPAPVKEETKVEPKTAEVAPVENPAPEADPAPAPEEAVLATEPIVTEAPTGTEVVPTDTPATVTDTPIDATATDPALTDNSAPGETAVVPVIDEVTAPETMTPVDQAPVTEGVITPEAASIVAPDPEVAPIEVWAVEGNKATTNTPVELGQTYVAPQNDQVTVTFTKLPDNPGTLSIEEVRLSSAQVTLLGAASNVAYDITSTMRNGTFEYDLTLPKVGGVETGVAYVEKSAKEIKRGNFTAADVQTIEEDEIDQQGDAVGVSGLDHFTLWVPTNIIPSGSTSTLTLEKIVVGGTAVATDWWLAADDLSGGYFNGDSSVTDTVYAGVPYVLTESSKNEETTAGYSAGAWSCDSGVVLDGNGAVTLAAGSDVTCTITNTFTGLATLTLIKNVENGGLGLAQETDWILAANANLDSHQGVSPFTFTVTAGLTYTLSESEDGPAGYATGEWSCDSGIVPDANNAITLAVGDNVTCTITNTFDTVAPVISETTPIPALSHNNTPVYVYDSTEAGFLNFAGTCPFPGESFFVAQGSNSIAFGPLMDGTYADCWISVSDVAGNESNVLNIAPFTVDSSNPVIDFHADVTVEATGPSGAIVDYGVPNAVDVVEGTFPATCSPETGSLFPLGSTVITCEAYNEVSLAADPTNFTVMVEDTTAPSVTITAGTDTIEVHTAFTDAGATWTDVVDGSGTIDAATSGAVDVDVVGDYTLTYEYTDSSGNTGSADRIVSVVDTTKPLITLLGDASVDLEVFSAYLDAGATAWDNYDGDLTGSLAVINSVVTSIPGNYTVSFNVVDSSGNAADEVVRAVNIVDTTVPVITRLGSDPVTVEAGTAYVDAGATASDNYDGDLTASIVTVNPVDANTVGSYVVTYNVADSSGNPAVEVTRTVDVVDTTAPTLVLTSVQTDPTNVSPINMTATFSEPVNGLSAANFPLVINGSVGNFAGSGAVYTFELTPSAQGAVIIDEALMIGVADLAGNGLNDVDQFVIVYDSLAPTDPIATPAAGDYLIEQSVTLTSTDGGSGVDKIYYTLDGTAPDNTKTLYAGALTIGMDLTLKAIAYDLAGNASGILTAVYGIAPVISAETASSVTATTATITWSTDDPATSRVIYDTVSHPVLDVVPNYGYANSTVETDSAPKVTTHSVLLSGLTTGTTYYYRVVSHGSPETVSAERSFTPTVVVSDSDDDDDDDDDDDNDSKKKKKKKTAAIVASFGIGLPGGSILGDNALAQDNNGTIVTDEKKAEEAGKVLGGEMQTGSTEEEGGFWGSLWMWLLIILLLGLGGYRLFRRKRNGVTG